MITVRPSHTRGGTHTEWLDSRHTFSFADYFDPAHMGFSALRVINEDRIAPKSGFPAHSHRDMEIITYVLDGALSHKDDMGNESVIQAGELQLMRAGAGVTHSEFNASDSNPVHLLQIWILPDERGLKPAYDQLRLETEGGEELRLVVARQCDSCLNIHQDAALLVGRLRAGGEVGYELVPGRKAYLQVVRGVVRCKGQVLAAGDGAAMQDESELVSSSEEGGEFLLFDLP